MNIFCLYQITLMICCDGIVNLDLLIQNGCNSSKYEAFRSSFHALFAISQFDNTNEETSGQQPSQKKCGRPLGLRHLAFLHIHAQAKPAFLPHIPTT